MLYHLDLRVWVWVCRGEEGKMVIFWREIILSFGKKVFWNYLFSNVHVCVSRRIVSRQLIKRLKFGRLDLCILKTSQTSWFFFKCAWLWFITRICYLFTYWSFVYNCDINVAVIVIVITTIWCCCCYGIGYKIICFQKYIYCLSYLRTCLSNIFLNSLPLGSNASVWLLFCLTASLWGCTNHATILSVLPSAAESWRTSTISSSPSSPWKWLSRWLPWVSGEKWRTLPTPGINWTCSLSWLGKISVVLSLLKQVLTSRFLFY